MIGAMKIESGRVNGTSSIRRRQQREPKDGDSFQVEQSQTPGETARLTGLGGPTALGAVLLAQEEDTPQSRQRKSVRRAEDLLDRLDEIRISLLSGRIAVGKLESLRQLLASRAETTDNEKLQETLEAIDLRVAVELAKYHS